jgi:transcriptional regulator with XRE-family HTH domain
MADPFLAAIGRRIADLREAKGLSREELGKLAGTSHVTIGSIENGQSATNLSLLNQIAEALKTECWLLLKPEDSAISDVKRRFIQKILKVDDETAQALIPSFEMAMDGFFRLKRKGDAGK